MAAVRLDSVVYSAVPGNGDYGHHAHAPMENNRYYGQILLYSTETGELLAILPDFTIGSIRVAATSAAVTKHLARQDAVRLGILGSGKLAKSHAKAIAQIRKIEKALIYSPTEDHRKSFSREMKAEVSFPIQAVDDPRAVVENVDILICATNAREPIIDGSWVKPGTHIVSVVTGDAFKQRREVDDEVVRIANIVVLNSKAQAELDNQIGIGSPIQKGYITMTECWETGDVVLGRVKRTSNTGITLFLNNTGMGVQFVAAGAVVYRKALQLGIEHKMPTEWFLTDLSQWAKRGYFPSP